MIVGSSFIGLEVAASLRKRGLEVDVVGPEAVPLGRVLGDEVGASCARCTSRTGCASTSARRWPRSTPTRSSCRAGARLPADLVVAGIGVVPRTELAQAAGLAVDNGITVDDRLRTSAPDVYAAGDVARVPDARAGTAVRIEHFVVAERQGQAAARSLLGVGGPYRDVPFFWSQHHDVTLSYVGHAAELGPHRDARQPGGARLRRLLPARRPRAGRPHGGPRSAVAPGGGRARGDAGRH